MPSFREGLSNVILESLAVGRPVIASNVPGCKDIIENNYSGILVPPKDLKRLKRAIKLFLENIALSSDCKSIESFIELNL